MEQLLLFSIFEQPLLDFSYVIAYANASLYKITAVLLYSTMWVHVYTRE